VIFGFDQERSMTRSLNDYLWGDCELREAAHEVTPEGVAGTMSLVPSSMRPGDIARVMHEGYDVNRLNEGFRRLIDDLGLDVLILDTHPGINEETLLSIAMSNVLIIVLRPDQQDYEGQSCYVFSIKAKEDLAAADKDRIVIDNMITWFNAKTMEVMARNYDMSYRAGVYDFSVHMEVQLMKFGEYLVPKLLRYTGDWDVIFKKRERGVFTATLFDFAQQ
jgi:MinD-like ATPase involved in chromosome partitioning or flagellar assembly